MKRLSYAKKRDANEHEIVSALRKIGATVILQDDPTDLIVGYRGKTILIEIKTKKGKLTDYQVSFFEKWNGGSVHVVSDVETALDVVTRKS